MKRHLDFHYCEPSYHPNLPILRESNVGEHSSHNWDFLKPIERRALYHAKKCQPPNEPVVRTGSANG